MEKTLLAGMMRRGALACYAVGIIGIFSSYALSIITFWFVRIILSDAVSGHLGLSSILELVYGENPLLIPVTLTLVVISLLFTIIFAYYSFRVGQAYGIGMIQIAGPSYVIWQLAAIPESLAAYQAFAINWSILSPSAIVAQVEGLLPLVLSSVVLDLVFLWVFVITFAIGLSTMKTKTDINLFRTAMVLAVVGGVINLSWLFSYIGINIIVGPLVVVLQFAIIVFGLALNRAAQKVMMPRRLSDRSATEQG